MQNPPEKQQPSGQDRANATLQNWVSFSNAMLPHMTQILQGENPILAAGMFAQYGDGRLFSADYAEEGVKQHVHLPFLVWACQQLADDACDREQADLLAQACAALTKVADLRTKAIQAEARQH